MKYYCFGILIFFCAASSVSIAQQNLFNVPSSDITLKSKPFFQQQFNISNGLTQLNSTFCLGIGNNAELGFNVLGLNINTNNFSIVSNGNLSEPPVYPFFTFNFQKAFVLNDVIKLSIGTQTGFSKDFHFGTYNYGNMIAIIKETRSKLITGIYQSSDSFLGGGTRNSFSPDAPLGFQLGIEQELIENWVTLIAENITGKHNLGETTLGAACYVLPHWSLSLGYQFANRQSNTMNATVAEVTYVPSAHVHKKIFRQGHHHKA